MSSTNEQSQVALWNKYKEDDFDDNEFMGLLQLEGEGDHGLWELKQAQEPLTTVKWSLNRAVLELEFGAEDNEVELHFDHSIVVKDTSNRTVYTIPMSEENILAFKMAFLKTINSRPYPTNIYNPWDEEELSEAVVHNFAKVNYNADAENSCARFLGNSDTFTMSTSPRVTEMRSFEGPKPVTKTLIQFKKFPEIFASSDPVPLDPLLAKHSTILGVIDGWPTCRTIDHNHLPFRVLSRRASSAESEALGSRVSNIITIEGDGTVSDIFDHEHSFRVIADVATVQVLAAAMIYLAKHPRYNQSTPQDLADQAVRVLTKSTNIVPLPQSKIAVGNHVALGVGYNYTFSLDDTLEEEQLDTAMMD